MKNTKINPLEFAKFQALLFGLLGLLAGILYSFGGLIIDLLVTLGMIVPEVASTPGLSRGTLLAFGALFGMPVICALIGFIVGPVEAMMYNLVRKKICTAGLFQDETSIFVKK